MTSDAQDSPDEAPAPGVRTLWVLGTPLTITSYADFSRHCLALCRQPGTHAVDFSNTQIVTMRRSDLPFRAATEVMDYFIPDGMPLIWCLNAQGAHLRDRVYGPTFMRHMFSSSTAGYTHYLLGGSVACATALRANLLAANPGVAIVGQHHGYFTEADEPAIIEEINRLSPDFIWIGLGTPKQQYWIARNLPRIRRGVLFAVGFAFDVNAGTKRDAPPWMQRAGLTWLFRTASEPRRLIPRYIRYNSLFLWFFMRDLLRRRAFRPQGEKDSSQTP